MIPDDFRDKGLALQERVRAQIDVPESLDRLHGRRRRSRAALAVAGAAAVIAIVVGTAVVRTSDQPIGGPPSAGVPVTVYLALLDDFAVENEELGHCTGTGIHAGMGPGSQGALVDEPGSAVESFTIAETGALIDGARSRALGIQAALVETIDQACLFELVTTSMNVEELGSASLTIGNDEWPPAGASLAGSSTAGQQFVFYSRGEQP